MRNIPLYANADTEVPNRSEQVDPCLLKQMEGGPAVFVTEQGDSAAAYALGVGSGFIIAVSLACVVLAVRRLLRNRHPLRKRVEFDYH